MKLFAALVGGLFLMCLGVMVAIPTNELSEPMWLQTFHEIQTNWLALLLLLAGVVVFYYSAVALLKKRWK